MFITAEREVFIMNKLAVVLMFSTLLASGCISQLDSDQNETEGVDVPDANENEDNTIYLTDSGFEPENIIVEQGETVTWVNNASGSMWIASDQHPTHTEYSGTSLNEHCSSGEGSFDQCQTGDEYSFTFDQQGTWGYHNHEPLISGGQVIVE
jgi:plastocyanin